MNDFADWLVAHWNHLYRSTLQWERMEMTKTRTHFTFRIDTWTPDGESVVEHVASVEDYQLALATYRTACQRWPGNPITLRQGERVIEDSQHLRMASWPDKSRQGGR